jgi:uncharacterized protein YdeI (YjbR/CyaY-like superfamily)
MSDKAGLPILFFVLFFETPEGWAEWLEENVAAPGVWLKFAKKGSGVKSINYALALDVALQYGWIDTMANKLDDTFYLQKFTPRRAKSVWSKRNREKVEAFIAEGKLKPAGLAEVERAKADGRWEVAYVGQSEAVVPEDFLAELAKNKKAQAFYETLNKTNRYAIYYRLQNSKKTETRARNIQKFITMLAEGKKFY